MNHADHVRQMKCHCPACKSPMHAHALESQTGGKVEIDVCYDCNAIWFDQLESARLSPDGVIELFSLIHQRGKTSARPFPATMACVRCGDKLFEVSDVARNTRFKYQRCPAGHGRLTTFYHFLAEKQFVRELTPRERQQLCATVKQVKCSSCGAPVDVGDHTACPYCKSPITVLDKQAAEKAVQHYLAMRNNPAAAGRARRSDGSTPRFQSVPYESAIAPSRTSTFNALDAADIGINAVDFLATLAGRRLVAAGLGFGAANAIASDPALALVPIDTALSDDTRHSVLGEFAVDGGIQTADALLSAGVESGSDLTSSAVDLASDAGSGLLDGAVDLVGDGIGAIFEGIGSLF